MPEQIPKPELSHAKQERKMLEIMETRHRNAIIALQLEKLLGDIGNTVLFDVDGKPTEDWQRIKSEALEIAILIVKNLPKEYLSGDKNDADMHDIELQLDIENVIENYLRARHNAQIVSWIIRNDYKIELDTEAGAFNAGHEMFVGMEGRRPDGHIKASMIEGYWILRFDNPIDFKTFSKGADANVVAGTFSKYEKFRDISINVIAVGPADSENDAEVVLHERQHFINYSILSIFREIEPREQALIKDKALYPELYKLMTEDGTSSTPDKWPVYSMRKIKDELLAYLRDGSSFAEAVDFIDDKIYKHLLNPFSDKQKEEVLHLLSADIGVALYTLPPEFNSPNGRALLVYHLLDVPLHKMPLRIKYIVEYYENEFNKFKYLKPNEPKLDGSISDDDYGKAVKIRNKISVLVDRPSNILFYDISYEDQQRRMAKLKDETEQLRAEYDKLINS